jgi:lipoteichoic acid synthase
MASASPDLPVPSNTPGSPAREREGGRGAAALAFNLVVVGLLLALVVIAGKVHKLVILADVWRGRDLLAVLGADLGYLLLLGGAAALAVTRARGIWLVAVEGVLYLGLLLLLLVGVVEHGFFAIQHEFLPGEMLVYGVRSLSMLAGVLESKMNAFVWLALGACALILLLSAVGGGRAAAALGRWRVLRTSGRPREGLTWLFAGAWLLALAASFALSRLEVDAHLRHLKGNSIVTVMGEALRSDPDRIDAPRDPRREARLTLIPTPATRRHNVVFVVLESTRARSATPYAPEMATTPFLGRLAERALRVEHAYAVVPHTSKALVSIQCGVHPKITTAIQEANPGGVPSACLAELLDAQGYATAFIQPAEEEFERRRGLVANFGFEIFMGKESLPTGFEESSYFGYEDDSMLEPALAWVDRQTRPFFLTVLTLTAHHDYHLPKSFPKRELAAEQSLNRYLNALAYTDRFVERLFAGFDQRSLLGETLFVIVGDHGEAFGEHGRSEHDNVLYEEGVAVPLLLVGAGLEEAGGRVVSGLRETSDIVPTVLEVLGFESRGGDLQGTSLLSTPGHERLFFSCWYTRQCMALREGSRKTLYHYERLPPEVFDLLADPLERRNLAPDRVAPEVVAASIERLKAWKRENNAHYRAYTSGSSSGPAAE